MRTILLAALVALLSGCLHRQPKVHIVTWYPDGQPKMVIYDNFQKSAIIQIGGTNKVDNGTLKIPYEFFEHE